MPADGGGAFEDGVTDLTAEQRKLGAIESLDVLGRCRLRKASLWVTPCESCAGTPSAGTIAQDSLAHFGV